jgi:hypothetical protein
MFMKLSNRDAFGHPVKSKSAVDAGLVDTYNNANTKLYLDGAIEDSAKGNAIPVSITNVGVTLDDSNNIVFDGATAPDYLQMPVANFTQIFALTKEWKVDLLVTPNTTRGQSILLGGVTSNSNGLGIRISDGTRLTAYYNGWINLNTQLSPPGSIVNNTEHFITIEKWLDGEQWKVNVYINGISQISHSRSDFALYTTMNFHVSHHETDRGFLGSVNKVHITNTAEHRGVNFTP